MKIFSKRSLTFAVVLATAAATHAQKTFDVRHNYNLSVNFAPNTVARTRWVWDDEAMTSGGSKSNTGDMMGGNPFAGTKNATQTDATGTASATSEVQFNLGPNTITGFNHVFGSALANRPPNKTTWRSTATATSTFGFNVGVKDAKGRITWQPTWHVDTVTGSASHWRDPLDFSILNLDTGELLTSQLFSMDLDFSTPGDLPAQSTWDNDFLDMSGTGAADGVLDLVMDSPYLTSGTGTLHLRFANGIVVESDDTGVFDGILPGVGSTDYGHLAIPTTFTMDFDFGGTSASGFDMGVSMGNGGSTADAMTGTPAPPASLSVIGAAWMAFRRRRRQNRSNGPSRLSRESSR